MVQKDVRSTNYKLINDETVIHTTTDENALNASFIFVPIRPTFEELDFHDQISAQKVQNIKQN